MTLEEEAKMEEYKERLTKAGCDTVNAVMDNAVAILTPDRSMTEAEYEIANRALNRTADDLINAIDKTFEESLVRGFKRRGYSDEKCQEILEDYRKRVAEKTAHLQKPW